MGWKDTLSSAGGALFGAFAGFIATQVWSGYLEEPVRFYVAPLLSDIFHGTKVAAVYDDNDVSQIFSGTYKDEDSLEYTTRLTIDGAKIAGTLTQRINHADDPNHVMTVNGLVRSNFIIATTLSARENRPLGGVLFGVYFQKEVMVGRWLSLTKESENSAHCNAYQQWIVVGPPAQRPSFPKVLRVFIESNTEVAAGLRGASVCAVPISLELP